jgi:PKD repeat protein
MLSAFIAVALWLITGLAQATSLAWDANSDNATVGYAVYYGTASGQYSTRVDVSTATTYSLANLQTGIRYYLAVRAYNSARVESNASNEVNVVLSAPPPPTTAPKANFLASTTSTTVPVIMNFVNESTGTITAYLWNFGDGSNSAAVSPTHIYQKAGNYSVKLTVTGPGGSSAKTVTIQAKGKGNGIRPGDGSGIIPMLPGDVRTKTPMGDLD